MPGSEAELRELDELRHKLTEYEAALRSAAPRLAAFKRLEQLARAKGSTPEAVAEQAAIEVLKREKDALVTLLAGLANERDQLKGETAMLLINKTEASKAVDALTVRHEELNIEVADLVDRLTQIRRDAVRLMSHRSELAVEVTALRAEAQALQDAIDFANQAIAYNSAADHSAADHSAADHSAADHSPADHSPADHSPADHSPADHSAASDPPASDGPAGAGEAVLARRHADNAPSNQPFTAEETVPANQSVPPVAEAAERVALASGPIGMQDPGADARLHIDGSISLEAEALAAELEQSKADKKRRQGLAPRRTVATSIATDDETEMLESQAFDAFFHAEVDHDKSRDWILG